VTGGPVKLAIVGLGKMGRAIDELAPQRGFVVVARIDVQGGGSGSSVDRDALNGADVAVEFTVPEAAADNVEAIVGAGVPAVVGTTGWYDRLPELAARVERDEGALLYSPNFSIGVNVFEQIVAVAGRMIQGIPMFDAHLVETHHTAKKDAPSGTAKMLGESLAATLGRDIPMTSVRVGSVPGTHELIFDAPFETIRLAHVARDRRVFAEGALAAARWVVGRKGVFTMRDVLTTGGET
jgi:4-hydroxy-tetrahydrodipicolinate reductase